MQASPFPHMLGCLVIGRCRTAEVS